MLSFLSHIAAIFAFILNYLCHLPYQQAHNNCELRFVVAGAVFLTLFLLLPVFLRLNAQISHFGCDFCLIPLYRFGMAWQLIQSFVQNLFVILVVVVAIAAATVVSPMKFLLQCLVPFTVQKIDIYYRLPHHTLLTHITLIHTIFFIL